MYFFVAQSGLNFKSLESCKLCSLSFYFVLFCGESCRGNRRKKKKSQFDSWTASLTIWLGGLWQMIGIRKFKRAALNVKDFTLHSFISHSPEQPRSSEETRRWTIGPRHSKVWTGFVFLCSLGTSEFQKMYQESWRRSIFLPIPTAS